MCWLQIRNQQRNQTRRNRFPKGWSRRRPHLGSPRCRVLHCSRRFDHQHRIHLRRKRLPTDRIPLANTTPNSSRNPRFPQTFGYSAKYTWTSIPMNVDSASKYSWKYCIVPRFSNLYIALCIMLIIIVFYDIIFALSYL